MFFVFYYFLFLSCCLSCLSCLANGKHCSENHATYFCFCKFVNQNEKWKMGWKAHWSLRTMLAIHGFIQKKRSKKSDIKTTTFLSHFVSLQKVYYFENKFPLLRWFFCQDPSINYLSPIGGWSPWWPPWWPPWPPRFRIKRKRHFILLSDEESQFFVF